MKLLTSNNKPWRVHFIFVAVLIKIAGVAFATLAFGRFTPLVDSQLYLSGFYKGASEFRTFVVQWLALSLNNFGSYFSHFIFALISISGLVYYYKMGGRRLSLLLTLLFPSSLVWSSIVGKEAIYCGFAGLVVVLWSIYTARELRWHQALFAIVSLGICFSFRPHYAVALFWLFISTFAIRHLKDKASAFLISILAVGALLVYFSVWDELLWRAYSGVEFSARASRFEFFGIAPLSPDGFHQFKSYVPLGMLLGIVGPLPSEVLNRVELLPFFIEGLIILFLPVIVYGWAVMHPLSDAVAFRRIFWWSLMPAILMVMVFHAPFGVLNPGSAIRWRTNFEQLFYLAPLLLLFRFKDTSR